MGPRMMVQSPAQVVMAGKISPVSEGTLGEESGGAWPGCRALE